MRIQETKLYTFDELSEPAKEKAREWMREGNVTDNFYLEEIYASLKAVFKAANVGLKDWQLGANSYNYVKFNMGDAGELTGKRALAWLENNLFASLRITPAQFREHQKEYLGYGADYRVGKVKPCPLTGMSADEDFLDDLKASIKSDLTLNDAFHALADKCRLLCDAEIEYRNANEQIDEGIRANEYEFTDDGKVA